jgi:hypothetical protein
MRVMLRRLTKGAAGRRRAWDFERRGLSRQSLDWLGVYAFGEDCGAHTGHCRVLDVSELGAGIEAFGDAPADAIGCRVGVHVPCPGSFMGLELKGVVGNVGTGRSGGVRLGIEFSEFSEDVFFLILSEGDRP